MLMEWFNGLNFDLNILDSKKDEDTDVGNDLQWWLEMNVTFVTISILWEILCVKELETRSFKILWSCFWNRTSHISF